MFTAAILSSLLTFGSKFIENKDKKTEFAFKVMNSMLSTKTYPWVDALVKLSYASGQIIKGLFRPIVSSLMMVFAVYASYKGIHLDPVAQSILYGSFPAWGASRHIEKMNNASTTKSDSDKGDKDIPGWSF